MNGCLGILLRSALVGVVVARVFPYILGGTLVGMAVLGLFLTWVTTTFFTNPNAPKPAPKATPAYSVHSR